MSVFQALHDVMKRRKNNAFTAPLTLESPAGSPDLTLRTMDAADQEEWGRLRSVNERWLAPWESSDPHGAEPLTFKSWVNRQREEEREGTSIIFLMEHEGEIVGQISLGAIYPGPMRTGIIGYWIDEDHAGRGLTPLAVAMLADWALLDPTGPQLHRLEIDIVPENERSRRVVQKVGAKYEGVRRQYMYVHGEWRDHESYSLLDTDAPQGFVRRLLGDTPGESLYNLS